MPKWSELLCLAEPSLLLFHKKWMNTLLRLCEARDHKIHSALKIMYRATYAPVMTVTVASFRTWRGWRDYVA